VAFNPAGTQLATGSHDGLVRIWDVAKGEQVRQITAHSVPMMSQVYCLAWSPDAKQIVSGSLDHSLKLWDAGDGNLLREFKGYEEIHAVAALGASMLGLLSDPLRPVPFLAAYAASSRKTGEYVGRGHREGVFCTAFSPDGKLLASGSSDRTIKLWTVADGALLREFDNPHLKAAGGPITPAVPQAHPGWVYSVRFTPTGKYLVSAGTAPRNHGYLAVWNVADGSLVYGREMPWGAFYSVAVSPNGKLLAMACGPRSRQFQDVDSCVIRMPDLAGETRTITPKNP
jgi:WD40 repeat protein